MVIVILLVCGWLASTFLGSIDWAAVGRAIGRLSIWQVVALLAVLLVRQTLNALPLALFIPGLGPRRALLNDLTAALMAIVAPPPGDIVMRLSMFRSCSIDASRGVAGATLNMLVFYVNRLAVPILGLLVFVVFGHGTDRLVFAWISAAIAAALAVVIWLVVRSEGLATTVGTLAGRVVERFRSATDPTSWAKAATTFRGHIGERYRRGFPLSLAGLAVMVLADASILLLALRFVGVSPTDVAVYVVIGTFLIAYPLTIPSLMGLGIFDVVLLAAFTEVGGDLLEPEFIAALTVWRVTTILGPMVLGPMVLGPMVLGLGTTAHWKWRQPGRPADDTTSHTRTLRSPDN